MTRYHILRAFVLFTALILGGRPVHAQPYSLTTGVGDGSVTVGVDGYGAFGTSPGPDSAVASFDPIGAAGPIADTVFEAGLALRIGAAGPRAFLTSGMIGGSGGLPKATVTGTATTGTSNFNDPSGQLAFTLVQTIAPTFNGPVRTGSVLTQTYTIRNTTAGTLTFDLCRYIDTQRNVYTDGYFFAADGTEILYADENPLNPLVVGIAAIGGTPLASNRFEIKNFPTTRTDILAGTAFNDAIVGGPAFNVTMGLRNVFTIAAGATVTYTAHTLWGNGPAANVFFPNGPPVPAPGPNVLYGITWGTDQLITIGTTPSAGIGLGRRVGALSSAMQTVGPAFRGSQLYTFDVTAGLIRELNPLTAATVASTSIGAIAGAEGDLVLRSDGTGFLSTTSAGGGSLYRVDLPAGTSNLIASGLTPQIDGLALSGAGVLYGLAQGGAALHTINPTTGAATLVGNTGITGGPFFVGGLTFDASGNLYAAVSSPVAPTYSFLYRLDPATGSATLIGNIGFDAVAGIRIMVGTAPPPGGAGGVGEGTYGGSSGPGGSEGGFGFGGGILAYRAPILRGPLPQGDLRWRVDNVSPAPSQQANAHTETDPSAWSFLAGLAGALFLGAILICPRSTT